MFLLLYSRLKQCKMPQCVVLSPPTEIDKGGESESWTESLLELPLLSTHGTLLLHLLRVQPLQDAVHVETVGALTPDQRAVVSRYFTCKKRNTSSTLKSFLLLLNHAQTSWAEQVWHRFSPGWPVSRGKQCLLAAQNGLQAVSESWDLIPYCLTIYRSAKTARFGQFWYSHSGQQPLKAILQIPQLSSLATHNQEATPFHWRIFTFILLRHSNRTLTGDKVQSLVSTNVRHRWNSRYPSPTSRWSAVLS